MRVIFWIDYVTHDFYRRLTLRKLFGKSHYMLISMKRPFYRTKQKIV